jgi:hypothetical protein
VFEVYRKAAVEEVSERCPRENLIDAIDGDNRYSVPGVDASEGHGYAKEWDECETFLA